MIEKELKIREVSGDYALDIPFADGSVNTIYFNSKRNAETVKHIIKLTEVNPTKQPCVICKRLSTEVGNMTARVSVMQIIYVLSVATFSLFMRTLICTHIVPIAVQKWISGEQQCLVKNADCNTQIIALIAYM